jgi:XTP/dITP diphosphohydrolase
MMDLCFASRNAHKRDEIQAQLAGRFRLLTLDEVGIGEEIPEDEPTIEGNSLFKAQYVWQRAGINCFADDSGLEVAALGGAPGVHTAYYAGPQRNAMDNNQLLLSNLEGQADRRAQFKTVITLVWDGQSHQFTGIVAGEILLEPRGEQGFGYDPIFRPEGHLLSFAQMGPTAKNQISHRAKAVQQLVAFLAQQP